jgi:phosphoribosylglycinamide formyltransferase-1
VRIGVLASGSGTILDAILTEGIPIEVVVVDRPCAATEIAARHGVTSVVVARDSFGSAFDRLAFTEQVVDALGAHGVDLVVMAGFMTVLDKPIFDAFEGRVLNTHPSLLPSFRGAHAVREALAFGVKVTGTTVHVATVDVDDGPILAQEAVPILDGDDEATLHERIKAVERRLYPSTIKQIIERGAV